MHLSPLLCPYLSVVHEGHEEGLHAVVQVLRQHQLVVAVRVVVRKGKAGVGGGCDWRRVVWCGGLVVRKGKEEGVRWWWLWLAEGGGGVGSHTHIYSICKKKNHQTVDTTHITQEDGGGPALHQALHYALVLLAAGVEEAALHAGAEGAQRVPHQLRLPFFPFCFFGQVGGGGWGRDLIFC